MWARISEMILGVWIAVSHWIFAYDTGLSNFGIAGLIWILAGVSFFPKWNKMHLLQLVPIGWMLYEGFIYPTPILPFALQNYVVTAFLLLMFAPLPSWAADHPIPWQKFLQDHNLP